MVQAVAVVSHLVDAVQNNLHLTDLLPNCFNMTHVEMKLNLDLRTQSDSRKMENIYTHHFENPNQRAFY